MKIFLVFLALAISGACYLALVVLGPLRHLNQTLYFADYLAGILVVSGIRGIYQHRDEIPGYVGGVVSAVIHFGTHHRQLIRCFQISIGILYVIPVLLWLFSLIGFGEPFSVVSRLISDENANIALQPLTEPLSILFAAVSTLVGLLAIAFDPGDRPQIARFIRFEAILMVSALTLYSILAMRLLTIPFLAIFLSRGGSILATEILSRIEPQR